MHYRKEIDGLRAVAIVPVVLFHASVPGLTGGFTGVDVFFVISGYLITGIIAAELAAGRFTIARFYERRARRILPALFPVLLATSLAAWAVFTPDLFHSFGQALASTALFSSNILFAAKSDYFAGDEGFEPLLHGWSLSVEEQFYLIFPLLMIVCWRFRRGALLPLALGLFAVSFVFAAATSSDPAYTKFAFYMLPTRMWELMAGAICALLPARPAPRELPALAGLALILAGFAVIDSAAAVPGPLFLLPVAGTALVLLYAGPATLAGRLLGWRPLVLLGLVSYGTYLWHQPIIAFLQYHWFGPLPLWVTALAVATAPVMGALSYWLIERPVREKRVLGPRRELARACLGGLVVAVFAGMLGNLWLLHPRSENTARSLTAVYAGAFVPPITVPAGELTFVLYGDSHARQYYRALRQRLGNGALMADMGCLSVPGLSNRRPWEDDAETCQRRFGDFAALVQQRKVRTVIWAQRWDRLLWDNASGAGLGVVSRHAGPPFRAGLERALAALPPDVHVVLIGNIPTAWAAGPQMHDGYLRCSAYLNADCPRDYPVHLAEGRVANRLLKAFADAHPQVEFIDPQPLLCPAGRCRILEGGMLYYNDGSHLTPRVAERVMGLLPDLSTPE